jgi:hypothetical protein
MEPGSESWFERRKRSWYAKDHEKPGGRFGEVVASIAVLLVTFYFVYSQLDNTGFFTSSFRTTEEVLFYLPVPLGIAVNCIRLATGRRNPARPLEFVDDVVIAVAAFWMLAVFPFNFAHLTDLLPGFLRFLLSWVSNDIGRIALFLIGLGTLCMAVYTPIVYSSVRNESSKRVASTS